VPTVRFAEETKFLGKVRGTLGLLAADCHVFRGRRVFILRQVRVFATIQLEDTA
jgi:hypothetical protein